MGALAGTLCAARLEGVALSVQPWDLLRLNLRRTGWLSELPLPWESTGGNYVDLFDAQTCCVGPVWERSQRLRVNFNDIGPIEFCPVVRRDEALAARGQQVLDRLRAWAGDANNQATLDRVLSWACLADNDFLFDFKSTPCVYAHWNGETAARFVTTCAEQALARSLIGETQFIQAYDWAFDRVDRAFNLPNRTVNLLIQWIRQNGMQMPARRRNAPELVALQPAQIDHIAAIVAECFSAPEQAPSAKGPAV